MNLAKAKRIWQLSTGILALFIIAILIVWRRFDPKVNIFQWLFWLHLPLLMLHEFEEYIFPGGFKEFFNTKTLFALPKPHSNVPLGNPMIFIINIGAWVLIIIGALLANIAPWFGAMMVVFELINVVGHGGLFQLRYRGYNPGFITATFLLLPYIAIFFYLSITKNLLNSAEYVLSIVGGITLALLLPAFAAISIKSFKRKTSPDPR
ncbi:MAG: HXXEE domain-containing protein [Candidatus Omnitrophota bacterium]